MMIRSTLMVVVLVGPVCALHAGELDPAQEKWFKQYEKQQNVPKPAGDMLINTDPEPKIGEKFESLFNGTDLNSKLMMQEFAVAVRDPDRNALEHLWKSMVFQDGLNGLEIALRVMQEYELLDPDSSINTIRWHKNWRIRDTMLKAIRRVTPDEDDEITDDQLVSMWDRLFRGESTFH